jgi:hypothetical protein
MRLVEDLRSPGAHTLVGDTVVCVHVDRLSVALDAELGTAVRQAAAEAGMSVSAWVGAAAADRIRNELLGAALDAYEADMGAFSDEELDEAAKVLGVNRSARGTAT